MPKYAESQNALVSADWLHEHLDAPNLVILDASIPKVVGNDSELSINCISSARFFDIKQDFSDLSGSFPNTYPSKQAFEHSARKLGINNHSLIIVYDDIGIYSSARAWWLFRSFGHTNIAILNGGLPDWLASGYPVDSKKKRTYQAGDFTAKNMREGMCFFEDVQHLSNADNTYILDARSEQRFSGSVPEPRKGLRSGTIPNSASLPYESLLDHGKMKSKVQLQHIFSTFGNKEEPFVFSCGSGITACVLALGAFIADFEDLTVYDGSWTEYGSLTKK